MIVLQEPRLGYADTDKRRLQEDIGLMSMKRMTLVVEAARRRGAVNDDKRDTDACDIDDQDAHTEIAYQALLSNDPRQIRHAETLLEREIERREAQRLSRERSEEQRRRYYVGAARRAASS